MEDLFNKIIQLVVSTPLPGLLFLSVCLVLLFSAVWGVFREVKNVWRTIILPTVVVCGLLYGVSWVVVNPEVLTWLPWVGAGLGVLLVSGWLFQTVWKLNTKQEVTESESFKE